MIRQHLTEYAELPVVEFLDTGAEESLLRSAANRARRAGEEPPASTPHRGLMEAAKEEPGSVAWRLRLSSYSEEFVPYLARFVEEVDTTRVRALVIGDWGFEDGSDLSSRDLRDALIGHAEAFPELRSLFVGDVTFEENEISWIQQCDLAPLLAAYPRLEELAVRGVGDTHSGGGTLSLNVPEHRALRSLTVQSGGLPGRLVREVLSSGLPALERLELWLGVDHYGGDTTPEDLAPLLSGKALPALRHLGLRNSQRTGAWVRALAEAPVTSRLSSLDLSLGSLRNRDTEHLLAAVPAFAHLESLDLHHHYLGEENTERVRAALTGAGVRVDLSDRKGDGGDDEDTGDEAEDDYDYYPAVGE
ncbi:STM4015 family protein [Nocardiopsis ganjiahuensis]|uniref:STM4015 family protein n=1 Tax=Nocardiopsis ganjiahuensis TaxID=239984 RepID=UPI00034C667D|nr:STM4015 family protein [Nocardiopsis ganjiahuensis]